MRERKEDGEEKKKRGRKGGNILLPSTRAKELGGEKGKRKRRGRIEGVQWTGNKTNERVSSSSSLLCAHESAPMVDRGGEKRKKFCL